MKQFLITFCIFGILLAGAENQPGQCLAAPAMYLDSLTGPVTKNELEQFKGFMADRQPADHNIGNRWVYGSSGHDTEALGIMYEINGDIDILNQMIRFTDAGLSARNDPNSGRIIWTGKRELCWPNKRTTAPDAAYSGTENGDVIGHIAYCAELILQAPSVWKKIVPVGDPCGYGTTYRERALTYVRELDRSLDSFVIPWFVDASDAYHYRFPIADGWRALGHRYNNDAGHAAPWNHQAMLNNGFLRLERCHKLLNDDPQRVRLYHTIVQSNIDWFLDDLTPHTHDGRPVYDWGYSLGRTSEDTAHGSYDMWGLWRAYLHGEFDIPPETMVIFANTLYYVIYDPNKNNFWSRVDGTNNPGDNSRSYISPGFIMLSEYLTHPDLFPMLAATNREHAKTRPVEFAMLCLAKHRRFLKQSTSMFAPSTIPPKK